MNREELGKLYPITVTEYDGNWPLLFQKEKKILKDILGSKIALRIEHIGSTAVENLLAKPTIDILIEIPKKKDIRDLIINKMSENGYIHMKEQKNHLMFVKGYSPTGLENESFHIHMGTKAQESLWDRLYFRDYLKLNPSIALEYAELKKGLAKKYKHDREAYTESKGEFIKRITEIGKEKLK
ncbi:GrpB family protein [Dethiothermospora halolimnae]|uniref:GrpB family protein n=1 Tax=Dethiothermospora halolimnae TaxID=3114390 RepID=UPI003CCBA7BE